MCKRIVFVFTCLLTYSSLTSQIKIKDKKYQSLLWEITGKGLSKPSFLIGTMHVSSKLAFHLPDSFYYAIRQSNVVALETNPETWQEDMSKYDFSGDNYFNTNLVAAPNEFLYQSTLKFYKYEDKIKNALFSNPSIINNLLYRSYGNEASDFEEDTYLDMYIFQSGKKLGKKIAGVEDYGESMKLMAEAYLDATKDKNKKQRSYEYSEDYSDEKLQEAYRTGNLDVLDSINKYNSTSDAFDEKFLYKRNEIQANSIDSIIKSGSSLFVGVGAAHLPGDRGVIMLLRKMGYKVRPVKMGERDSRDKELIEKIRVPVTFKTVFADDSLFQADVPGKLYTTNETDQTTIDERQYADMANGSFYKVTRIMTHAFLWGNDAAVVFKKVDSLLYENIPGKIISKTFITKNGFKGIDLTSKTRRGDLQRYNIFVTPFEVLIFKMGGNGDYIKNGDEASKFFGSIRIKEYESNTVWKKIEPPFGGFAINLPHQPFVGNDGSWIFDAIDATSNTKYRIIRTDIHNFQFAEKDSFDLELLNESFISSDFIDSSFYQNYFQYKGYPALDGKYYDKSGNIFLTRFIIRGPHFYTLIAMGKKESAIMSNFLNSFEIKSYQYGNVAAQKDTALYFSVLTPYYPASGKIKLDFPQYSYFGGDDAEDENTEEAQLETGTYRSKTISNDSTGEKIFVSFDRVSRYHYSKDSASFNKSLEYPFADSSWVFKLKSSANLPNTMKVWESIATEPGSSRAIWSKTFYKDGVTFNLSTETDTLNRPSSFLSKFFSTFTPVDTLKGVNPFVKKSAAFFADFMSKDSLDRKRAVAAIDDVVLDAVDLKGLKAAISSLNWNDKNYLDTKQKLVNKLGGVVNNESADYLRELYYALGDTVSVQYAVLENLLQQKTAYAYSVFKNIINTEPPVKDANSRNNEAITYPGNNYNLTMNYVYDNGDFMDELTDTLALTKSILPDLLPLLNLDDYKNDIMTLMGKMVDSNVIKPIEYETYFSKFYLEARQELKKQAIAETRKSIEKAEENKKGTADIYDYWGQNNTDNGNESLNLYARLLLPFADTKPVVIPLLQKMLQSNDKRLKFNTTILLLRNHRQLADTLIPFFAGLDDYKYELYNNLKDLKKLDIFPSKFNLKDDLAKSKLLFTSSYVKPDTIVFLKKQLITYSGKNGYIYFYKYKNKKIDLTWKLASSGLIATEPDLLEYTDKDDMQPMVNINQIENDISEYSSSLTYDFTGFSENKLSEDEPLPKQLNKFLKKLILSKRRGAQYFYEENNSGNRYGQRHMD
ncbi:MAG TPA: TraB/GumN family protein [Chitinophagaceae bacterium]|nr:TraB/GumN family protein [Chitinophagaceae bacterium]